LRAYRKLEQIKWLSVGFFSGEQRNKVIAHAPVHGGFVGFDSGIVL
jgi:hypothetical protein